MNKGFAITEENGLKFMQIPSFTNTGQVKHGFSTRTGGVSQPPYAALNLAAHVGDNPEHVLENRLLFSTVLGINPRHWVTAKQVHGDRVYRAAAGDKGRGARDYESSLDCMDALITNEPGVPLATFYADCVPVFILDTATPAIGLAHAGWKGTVAKIPGKTLLAMAREFGTRPENCLAGIAPSIGPCCYEVDEYVMNRVREAFPYWQELATEGKEPGKWLLNLWEANRRQLLDQGVRPERITVAETCTNCHPETFFSYRAENGTTGRMSAVIMLKQP
ncbi:MAG: peptidoglycan editing factor PgeF [Clostridia bacterium]|nr:peptidoglycan editing factor PgeF [Clostridia bacterium]